MSVATVSCPDCGTEATLSELNRSADEFCSSCDYPLFWITEVAHAMQGGVATGGEGHRRLPGTAGRRELGAVACPACGEHQPIGTNHCGRCGGPMVEPQPQPGPAVEVVAPPPPPPPSIAPTPEPSSTLSWYWLPAVAATFVVLIVLMILV